MSKLTHGGRRALAIGLSVLIPLIGVGLSSSIATNAALASLKEGLGETAKRTHMSIIEVAAGTTEGDVINGILVGFVLLGAVVTGVGSIMRAAVHDWKTPIALGVDFSGKCLAVAGATIVVVAACVRFIPGAGDYTPVWILVLAAFAIGAGAVFLTFLGKKITETTPKPKCES